MFYYLVILYLHFHRKDNNFNQQIAYFATVFNSIRLQIFSQNS